MLALLFQYYHSSLAASVSCSDGTIPCPSGTSSAPTCVPALSPWCALPLWRNPFATPAARAADLIPLLSLQERVNLLQTTPANSSAVPRLGVLETTFGECLHGYVSRSPSTLFPQSITLAASFNPPLLAEVAGAIGREGRAWRNAWVAEGNASVPPPSLSCFSPQINIVRDPRWGRGAETFGEAPRLTADMAAAYVAGLQGGGGGGGGYLLATSVAKHFLAYQGASTRGQYSPTEIYLSWEDQVDTYETAWRAVVKAGAAAVMCAYSSLCHDDTNTTCHLPPPAGYGVSNGIPMCADKEMLDGWLRGGAGGGAGAWDGVVVGDCGAVQFIETDHRWADSQEGAAAAAINAGTDVDCSISVGRGFAALLNATSQGLTTVAAIDRALGRLLQQHFRLGLYDPPDMVPWAAIPMSVVNSAEHRGLAARAAREGLVLLKNAGGALPLSAGALGAPGAVLVTGPNAQLVASGNYNTQTDVNVTAWGGLARALPPGAAVLAPGCASVLSNDTAGFAAAVAAARRARVVVAVMGIDGTVEYEDSTRDTLALPGAQEALLAALAATGTPLVLVLVGGSALAPSPAALAAAAAIVWAGYGGEEAGTALADALLGAYNPGGRMPFTSYASVADLPPYSNQSMTGLPYGRTYRYFTGPPPVFRFADGFGYSPMAVALKAAGSAALRPCEGLRVDVGVTNGGAFDGDAVMLAFVRLPNATLRAPLHALAAFSRVPVAAGRGAVAASLALPAEAFTLADGAARGRVWAPGVAEVWVGSNQPRAEDWAGPSVARVQLLGPRTPLSACPL